MGLGHLDTRGEMTEARTCVGELSATINYGRGDGTTYPRACECKTVDKSKTIPSGCQTMRNVKVFRGRGISTRIKGWTIKTKEEPNGIGGQVLLEVCVSQAVKLEAD